jgi:hypothetical protein
MRGARITAALTLGLAVAALAAASAEAESSAQVRALAARAEHQPTALAQLRTITSVDGRPTNLAALLDTSGAALRGRLAALAARGTAVPGEPNATARADRILAQRRFTGSSVPRPFHRVLAWLGGKLSFVDRFVNRLGDHVAGGPATIWGILGLLALGLGAVAAFRIGARRQGRSIATERRARRGEAADPAALEREAGGAEERGDFELALRLRFRAGLIRLGRDDRLPLRDSLTSGQAADLLHLEDFDTLAHDFDEVVYGRRPPAREDIVRAREEWARVLNRSGRP